MIATDLRFRDEIIKGEKEFWVSHLDPDYGYILDQARLEFKVIV